MFGMVQVVALMWCMLKWPLLSVARISVRYTQHLCTGCCLVYVCWCLQLRSPTTSFADKNSVQRLAADTLPNQAHVTAFNVQVRCTDSQAALLQQSAW